VMHCIVMHIPSPQGGEQPTAYLRSPRGGEVLEPGTTINIEWVADDNDDVVIDLELSTDGGATFEDIIAANLNDSGSYAWFVPDLYSNQARVRVLARDSQGNTGSDQSDSDITINGTSTLVGDINLDGIVDVSDFSLFLIAFGIPCDPNSACPSDLDGNGSVNISDFSLLLINFGQSQ
jgi:hypothetical protein